MTAPVPQPGSAAAGRVAASDAPVYVGLMSGTSLDGITAAVVRFHDAPSDRPRAELLGVTQRAYAPAERERLARALEGTTAAEYCRLNFDLGGWLGDAAAAAARDAGVPLASVRAVASHGQTVWHDAPHSTWQFGESAVIAERTGVPVVSDFRVRDVAAGGHGAPLVAMADVLLFAAADAWRALQNLGGIGNVTVVPPAGAGAGLRAFDTGPGVAVIDGVVRLLHPDLPYDVDGRLARAGVPVEGVASALLADPYFASPPPKSTGRELFSAAYVEAFVARCRAARPACTPADVVATAVELTARSVGDAYHRFVAEPVGDVLVSGGGARNPALFDAVASALAPRTVRRFDEVFFDGEAKEAVAFALLGHLHLTGRPGNVPAATGAGGGRILGKLTPP